MDTMLKRAFVRAEKANVFTYYSLIMQSKQVSGFCAELTVTLVTYE